MSTDTFDIQQLITESGVPRRTIYFYVQQGLLPPPQGAGLAAFYTADHLLRLQLIPILRRQGLRLDQIRERIASLTSAEMRSLIDESQRVPEPETVEKKPASLLEAPLSPAPGLSGTLRWGEERFVQYKLPSGIILSAPEKLAPADRQRLEQLLQAASRIFAVRGPHYIAHLDDQESSNKEG